MRLGCFAVIGLLLWLSLVGDVEGWGWLHDSLFDDAAAVIDLQSAAVQHVHSDANRCPWIVLFYDSMCGHCRAFAPKYAAAAQRDLDLRREHLPILFGAVNCAAHENGCTAANVTSVPTLFVGVPSQQLRSTAGAVINTKAAFSRHTNRDAPDPTVTWSFTDNTDELPMLVDRFTTTLQLTPGEAAACRGITSFALAQKSAAKRHGNLKAEPHGSERGAVTNLASFGAGNHGADNATMTGGNETFHEETRLFQFDVGAAFYLTMAHEVPMAALSGEGLRALTSFLHQVSRSLPALGASELHRTVSRNPSILHDHARWRQIVRGVGIPFVEPPAAGGGEVVWFLCRGSSWKERGLPCGLWSLYHAMVVNAPPGEGAATLIAIRGYIQHFFTCLECRHHFASMAYPASGTVGGDNDAVLWLWDAHNQVNARLATEVGSSDPLVPNFAWRFLATETKAPLKLQHQVGPLPLALHALHSGPYVQKGSHHDGKDDDGPDDEGLMVMLFICIAISLMPVDLLREQVPALHAAPQELRRSLLPRFRAQGRGDVVVGQCRPLSKTVRYNVLQVISKSGKSGKKFAKN